ncbi:hypothetical protein HS088_TW17G00645 [Tripterygium wilfordii]|uniref:Uncharacterized protein n=1 Tax=Tripterygium wilfordii TaxID=458696 RepID=A0A7J7CGE8_TRIWF|nr:hypothetical protein HS088_TW17G00645 [Tripterygium wilfordii]
MDDMVNKDDKEMAEYEKERSNGTEEEGGSLPSAAFLRDLNLLIVLLSLSTLPNEDTSSSSTSQEKERTAIAGERVKTTCIPRFHKNNNNRINRHQELHQLQRKPRFQTIIKDFR